MNPLAVRAMECRIERLRRELEAAERELESLHAQAARERNTITWAEGTPEWVRRAWGGESIG